MSQGTNIPVAIVDSGIDYTHPDLASKYIGGWDFVNNDGDPMDDHGHGTHVAGTIAAAMNNPTGDPAADEGVVGVAPNAVILSYKVCTPDGSCDDFAIAQAIDRAVTDGARVINLSLGGTEYSQAMFDAVAGCVERRPRHRCRGRQRRRDDAVLSGGVSSRCLRGCVRRGSSAGVVLQLQH